jgi:hypothetical protein
VVTRSVKIRNECCLSLFLLQRIPQQVQGPRGGFEDLKTGQVIRAVKYVRLYGLVILAKIVVGRLKLEDAVGWK